MLRRRAVILLISTAALIGGTLLLIIINRPSTDLSEYLTPHKFKDIGEGYPKKHLKTVLKVFYALDQFMEENHLFWNLCKLDKVEPFILKNADRLQDKIALLFKILENNTDFPESTINGALMAISLFGDDNDSSRLAGYLNNPVYQVLQENIIAVLIYQRAYSSEPTKNNEVTDALLRIYRNKIGRQEKFKGMMLVSEYELQCILALSQPYNKDITRAFIEMIQNTDLKFSLRRTLVAKLALATDPEATRFLIDLAQKANGSPASISQELPSLAFLYLGSQNSDSAVNFVVDRIKKNLDKDKRYNWASLEKVYKRLEEGKDDEKDWAFMRAQDSMYCLTSLAANKNKKMSDLIDQTLIGYLHAVDERVRSHAVGTLSQRDSPEVESALLDALEQEDNPSVKAEIIKALDRHERR